jgi:hypothetical protein
MRAQGRAESAPKLAGAIQNYVAAYADVLPALRAPGGMAATLRAAPELAANMDAWLRSVRATELIPVRRRSVYSCAILSGRHGSRRMPPCFGS